MGEPLPFGSRWYFLMLTVMVVSRGMDFLSTWVATPHLVLEGNPIARRLGWKWGGVVNAVVCVVFAAWPITAITLCTTSLLVAARNFQVAWLMRTLGEEGYRDWHLDRLLGASATLYLFCLLGQTVPVAAVGGVLMYFSQDLRFIWVVPMGIGLGVVGYALAVFVFSLLSFWRLRRAWRPELEAARFEVASAAPLLPPEPKI